jgi:hypothetical protein
LLLLVAPRKKKPLRLKRLPLRRLRLLLRLLRLLKLLRLRLLRPPLRLLTLLRPPLRPLTLLPRRSNRYFISTKWPACGLAIFYFQNLVEVAGALHQFDAMKIDREIAGSVWQSQLCLRPQAV